jgi:hypothetical protein
MEKNFIQIKLKNEFKYSFCFLKNKKLLLLNINNIVTYYFEIKNYIQVFKSRKGFIDLIPNKNNIIPFFLTSFYRSLQLISKRILVLKGLGLKALYSKSLHEVDFKLGFSHMLKLKINSEIGIFIKKNLFYFQSINKENLGNLLNRIKNLKYPDSYRGKGIWYKNEKLKMKLVKKK